MFVVWILILAPLAPASAQGDRTLDTRFSSATSDHYRLHSNPTLAFSLWARDVTPRTIGTFRRRSWWYWCRDGYHSSLGGQFAPTCGGRSGEPRAIRGLVRPQWPGDSGNWAEGREGRGKRKERRRQWLGRKVKGTYKRYSAIILISILWSFTYSITC